MLESMTNLSEARQRNAVSEGFALGLMMCGYDSLRISNFTGTDVNLSIAYAWRHWEYTTRFPKREENDDPRRYP